jgi:hypothetical protein
MPGSHSSADAVAAAASAMWTQDQMPLPEPASEYLRSRTWYALSPSSVNQAGP